MIQMKHFKKYKYNVTFKSKAKVTTTSQYIQLTFDKHIITLRKQSQNCLL